MCQNMNCLALVIISLAVLTSEVNGLVHEVNQKTLKKFLQGKLFTLTFVDSPSCTRCRTLYPFYVTASQAFPNDPDIFFTRTHDPRLVDTWGISELPALVYHRDTLKAPQVLHDVDITVDDIIDIIARTLHGDFEGLSRTYAVQVKDNNYDELIMTPKQQHVLLMIHDKKDSDEYKTIETVAHAFRNDDAILLASLDVSKQRNLRDERFKTRETPVLMWFNAKEKSSPKRFGGVLSTELITTFVNEQTGLQRNHDGSLLKDAGRIPKADAIIEKHKKDIYKANPEKLEAISAKISALRKNLFNQHLDMLDYYLYVLENIALVQDTSVIRELIKEEEAQLYGREDVSTKTKDTLKRKVNILQHFNSIVQEAKALKKKKKDKKIVEVEQDLEDSLTEDLHTSHSHVHTEL